MIRWPSGVYGGEVREGAEIGLSRTANVFRTSPSPLFTYDGLRPVALVFAIIKQV